MGKKETKTSKKELWLWKQGQTDMIEEKLNWPLLALKMERIMSQGMWQPLEAGKSKKMDSSLEPLERNAAGPVLSF